MTETTNYKLKKPEDNDYADISILNQNMDKLDVTLFDMKNETEGIQSSVAYIESGEEEPVATLPNDADTLGGKPKTYYEGLVSGHNTAEDAHADIRESLEGKAPLENPAFSGTPTVGGKEVAVSRTVKITELLNGWTAWGNSYYPRATRSGDMVNVAGVLDSSSTGKLDSGTTLFVLPEGYRPAVGRALTCQHMNGPKCIIVSANGNVNIDVTGLGTWSTGRYFFDFTFPIKEG